MMSATTYSKDRRKRSRLIMIDRLIPTCFKSLLKKTAAGLVYCCLAAGTLFGQTIEFDNISLEEGLSQSVVTSVAQDNKGFLWLGTQSGLNKYDGRSFTHFTSHSEDSSSISNNWVTVLLPMPNNSVMWVGTSSGLNKFNLETETFTRYLHSGRNPDGLSNNWIRDLYLDEKGILWVGTQQGLNRFDPGTGAFRQVVPKDSRWDAEHFDILAMAGIKDEIWLGSEAGLLIYNSRTKSFTRPQDPKLEQPITSLLDDSSGAVWAGSTNGSVFKVDHNHKVKQHFSASDGIINAAVQSLNRDKNGNLWIGTIQGLNVFDPSKRIVLNTSKSNPNNPNSLSTSDVRNIFIDRSSVVWLSVYSAGVDKTNVLNNLFQHYKMDPAAPDGLKSNYIRSITEDPQGNIWLGTSDNGIEKFNVAGNSFSHHPHGSENPPSPSSNFIRRLLVDSDNKLWVSSIGVGVDRFNLDTWEKRTFTPKDGLPHKDVWVIEEDSLGYLWFGTYGGGVSRYNPHTDTFKTLAFNPNSSNSLSNNFVTSINPQSQDSIWIGTQGGLNIYNANTDSFTVYKHHPEDSTSLSDGPILDIRKGVEGDIWISTYGGGIDRFDIKEKTFVHYREKDGLAHNNTYNFLEDEKGFLWVSTNGGISRIDPRTEEIVNFSTSHGLQSKEFNNGAFHKTDEGIMYFGGINGFNRFDPSRLTRSDKGPGVAITKFALFNEEVPVGPMKDGRTILSKTISHTPELTLSHEDYVFSFEFAALDYAYPKKNTFAYKMEGLEEKWNKVGGRNYVSYTNMPAGKYTFMVKAADYNGVWSTRPAMVSLTVTPPFWNTTWFYVLSTLFVLGSIFAIYRIRTRSIHERNQKLEEVVEERTEELNQKNNDLRETLLELEETKDELVNKAHKAGMADIATGVLHNVGNILTSVNTSSSIIEQTLRNSKVSGLQKANTLLRNNMDNIEEFITENPKGKKLLNYYLNIEDLMVKEQQTMLRHNYRLNEKIHLINDVISTQQDYAGAERYVEEVCLPKIIDSALTLQTGSFERHGIHVTKSLDETVSPVYGQRTKIVHILVNLLKNAKEAIVEAGLDNEPEITIELRQDESHIYLSVGDNGCGIDIKDLNKIFTHGFTTKKDGHGFGLHSCSNYMTEMNGSITVDSRGQGKGALVTLIFPAQAAEE